MDAFPHSAIMRKTHACKQSQAWVLFHLDAIGKSWKRLKVWAAPGFVNSTWDDCYRSVSAHWD